MISGIGNDIIEIQRIRDSIEEHGDRFLNRLFTEEERAYCLKHADSVVHFAGRFAAKEAIVKALGCGFGKEAQWQDIAILPNTEGQPTVVISAEMNQRFGNPKILVSISHCKEYATAVAVLETFSEL